MALMWMRMALSKAEVCYAADKTAKINFVGETDNAHPPAWWVAPIANNGLWIVAWGGVHVVSFGHCELRGTVSRRFDTVTLRDLDGAVKVSNYTNERNAIFS